MKLICSLTLLFSLTFSWSQKTPLGFIIEFSSSASIEEKAGLFNDIPELKAYDPLLDLKGFDVYLAFTNLELSGDQYVLVNKQLESHSIVTFASLFYETDEGTFGGYLPEFFIQYKSNPDQKELQEIQAKTSCISLVPYNGIAKTYRVKIDKNCPIAIDEFAESLMSTGKFQHVCPNIFHSVIATTNDPYYDYQWAIENTGTSIQYSGTIDADMSVSDAWSYNMGEPYIKVAVLDSGTDTNHVDLVNNLLPGFDATGGGSNGYPNTTYANDGHGTSCAGIVAAEADNNEGVAGVAPNCKIIPVKIFYYVNIGQGPIPFASVSAGIDGIIWAVDTAGADVLSNSWGLRDQDIQLLGVDTVFYNQVISNLIISGRNGKGIPMLFSSGNDAANGSIWPAKHPMTISVGASTMCDELKTTNDCSPESWWGGNYGADLDVVAPGVKVLTTDHTGSNGFNDFSNNDYTFFNGTSAACPNAAGVMALILSEDSSLNYEEARMIISIAAEKVGGYNYGYPGLYGAKSTELGYGRVNAFSAMQLMYSTSSITSLTNEGEIRYTNGVPFLFFDHAESRTITFYDMQGKLIQTIISNETNIQIKSLSAGTYVCKVISEQEISTHKFIAP